MKVHNVIQNTYKYIYDVTMQCKMESNDVVNAKIK